MSKFVGKFRNRLEDEYGYENNIYNKRVKRKENPKKSKNRDFEEYLKFASREDRKYKN